LANTKLYKISWKCAYSVEIGSSAVQLKIFEACGKLWILVILVGGMSQL